METNTNLLSNELQIDGISQGHLSETAKWAKFIAIAGFIFSFLILVFAFYYVSLMSRFEGAFGRSRDVRSATLMVSVFYGVVAIVWIICSVYQLRFASKLLSALQGNDQAELNASLLNQRMYYRISGIVTIIGLIFSLIGVLGLMVTLSNRAI